MFIDQDLVRFEPGTGVFWHEPEPPYRVWFAVVVVASPNGELTISIPAKGRLVRTQTDRIHRDPSDRLDSCPYCQARQRVPGD